MKAIFKVPMLMSIMLADENFNHEIYEEVIMKKIYKLKDCMKQAHKSALGELPTTHQNCLEKCGVARPGKTNREHLKRLG